jgi:putative SOS response-associated peptidase YedK
MCGRYAASRRPEDLVEEFEVDRIEVNDVLEPDYNVAPTKPVYAVLDRVPRQRGPGSSAGEPERRLKVLQWGLVPSWAKEPSIGSRLINARMETVADKPAFRKAFAARRCLLPADGYYEWYAGEELTPAGKPKKQPFFIRPSDRRPLAMAGLYEIWRDRSRGEDDPEAFRWTCTIITTDATDGLGRIHERMPLLVEPDRYTDWLDPRTSDPKQLLALLVPAAPGRLEAYPVSTMVNDVRNNGAELIEPLAFEPAGPGSASRSG